MVKIGIDIDGTITEGDWLIKPLNEWLDSDIKYEDLIEYDCSHIIDRPKEEIDAWFRDNGINLYKDPLTRTGSVEAIAEWNKENEVFLISAREKEAIEVTETWLGENKVVYGTLELLGSHDKIAACKKYGVEIFMEDRLENALDISRECNIPVILFDCPYNRVELPENVIRVYNWAEAKNWVDNWISEKCNRTFAGDA